MIFLAAFIGALLFFVALIFILRTLIRSRKEVSEKLQYYTGYTPGVVEKKSQYAQRLLQNGICI